jgi:photosystem II stability/assembly factor-like uncharacterized protein
MSLGVLLWVQHSADLMNVQLSQDEANPEHLAVCAAGEIRVSPDGGQSWSAISTENAGDALTGSPYVLGSGNEANPPACLSVTLDASHPQSYYAVFQTQNANFGAPPVYFMGLATADNGQTWQRVPAPAEGLEESFGGFWTDGQGIVQALYGNQGSGPDQAPSVLVQESQDGGMTWNPGKMTCPTTGPCLRWGPAPSMIPGMGSPLPQWIYVSTDNGETWQGSASPVELRLQGPNELVAYSRGTVLLISGTGDYPLRFSQDGGLSWQTLGLPPLPVSDFPGKFPGLQLLSAGNFIAMTSSSGSWATLPSQGRSWCPFPHTPMPGIAVTLRFSGDRILWFDASTQTLGSAPLDELFCP